MKIVVEKTHNRNDKWETLGCVTIDSARLQEGQINLPNGDYQAMVVHTGLGDGRYRVEGRHIETVFGRRLAEVRVRFLGQDGGWLGADHPAEA